MKLTRNLVLSLLAGAGVVATGALAAWAAPKVEQEKTSAALPNPAYPYRNYIPAVLTGAGTILCIGSNCWLTARYEKLLLGAAVSAGQMLESYAGKVKVEFDARKAPIGSWVQVTKASTLDFAGETGQIADINGNLVEVVFSAIKRGIYYYYKDLEQGYHAEAYNPKKRKDETKMTGIKRVIFQAPATIVFWADGTKTVVKCSKNDIYDAEKGLAMAVLKKYWGKGYYNRMKKLLPEVKANDGE